MTVKRLLVVQDVDEIKTRGVLVWPGIPIEELPGSLQVRVLLKTPIGTSFEATAAFELPHISPPPARLEAWCLLKDLEKSQVPIGTELWIEDKR